MPVLLPLMSRYLAWIAGLHILYVVAVMHFGLPNLTGTVVILFAAPAMDIAAQAMRRSSRPLIREDWIRIAGALFATFLVVEFAVMALAAPGLFAEVVRFSDAGRAMLTVWVTTMVSILFFMWLGARQEVGRQT